MRYFLANGYKPTPPPPKKTQKDYQEIHFSRISGETRWQRAKRYREANVEIPRLGETVLLRRPGLGRISIFVHGNYDAFIMVVASSQRKAYLLGNALRAALTCFYGEPPPKRSSGNLLELGKRPRPDMYSRDLVALINPLLSRDKLESLLLENEIGCGVGVMHVHLAEGSKIVENALTRPRLVDALMHLEHSRNLVCGFMVGSFYETHYKRDRRELTRYQLERIYLENRLQYDSAFVSAFRGIECLLGRPFIKKREIGVLLSKADHEYGVRFSSENHRSWHEIFTSRCARWKYEEIISYYLDLRNAVSAHGNPSPPHIVMEDQVFEIQYILHSMLLKILLPGREEV
jgi:hypothetical protein